MEMNVFDPVKLSLEENAWLLKHLGEPWVVAGRDIHPVVNQIAASDPNKRDKNPILYPDGVNPNAVRPIIDKVHELNQLQEHSGIPWQGIEVLKEAIEVYLEQQAKWKADKRRGAPRFPSLHSYDTKGRPHWSGGGSDSGQVKTYFDAQGNRKEFAREFVPSGQSDWVADWALKAGENADQPEAGLVVNKELNRIECFCGHVEKFNPESRGSFNVARGRISKHLRSDANPETVEKHRELHTAEFGGRS